MQCCCARFCDYLGGLVNAALRGAAFLIDLVYASTSPPKAAQWERSCVTLDSQSGDSGYFFQSPKFTC